MQAVGDTQHWLLGQSAGSTNLLDIYTFLSHSLFPQHKGGELCPPQHLQQKWNSRERGWNEGMKQPHPWMG